MAVPYFAFGLLAGIFCSLPVLASSLLEAATGTVTAGAGSAHLRTGARIATGSKIVTAAKSQATLRLEDGHVVVLAENSALTVSEFAFVASDLTKSRFVLDLHKGAIRVISSPTADRARGAYVLRVPEASLGILGADFLAAVTRGTYVSVLKGTVTASNSAGAAVLGSGVTAYIGSAISLATPVPAITFPLAVTASFEKLGSIAVKTSWTPVGVAAVPRAGSLMPAGTAKSR